VADNPVAHNSDMVSMRDYVDLRFSDMVRAVDKAEKTLGDRLASMNEFRDQLKDQAARFITRDELTLSLSPVCSELKGLKSIADRSAGAASVKQVLWAGLLGLGGLLLSIIDFILKK
jgi:hypothetical protein